MSVFSRPSFFAVVLLLAATSSHAQEKPVVGLIPKAQKPIVMDGKLTGWEGAFVTPVHVGHPDFANRGGQFLYLWDEKHLYITDYGKDGKKPQAPAAAESGSSPTEAATKTDAPKPDPAPSDAKAKDAKPTASKPVEKQTSDSKIKKKE